MMLAIGVFTASVSFLFHSGHIGSSDGRSMYEVAKAIVEHRNVEIQWGVTWPGRDGHFYSPYGLGLSLVALVPYVAIRPLANVTSQPELILQAGVAAVTPIIMAFLAIALFQLARALGLTIGRSILVSIGSIFGTVLLNYSKNFFSEPLATLFIVVSIERSIAQRPMTAGISAGAAALTRPQCFLFAPLLLWRSWSNGGWRALFRAAVPIGLAFLGQLGYNIVRFDDVTNFGYSNGTFPQRFTTPFLQGAYGLLFHPAKSLFIFAPVVLLIPMALHVLWKEHRNAFWLLIGNFVITFILIAKWWAWHGGWYWGPRLLVPGFIPMIPIVGMWKPRSHFASSVIGGALLLGFIVNIPAVLVSPGVQQTDEPFSEVGPRVLRQHQLIAEATINAVRNYKSGQGPQFNLWQVKAARVWGTWGLIAASSLSGVLLLLAVTSLVPLVRAWAAAPI
jgi:hypothetical protein